MANRILVVEDEPKVALALKEGLEREAYFAGWLVIGDLLDHGWTFPTLARVKDDEMVELVGQSILSLEKNE